MERNRGLRLLIACLTLAASAGAAHAESPDEHDVIRLLNAARAEAGLAPLSVEPRLSEFARRHTADMTNEGGIFHSGRDARVASAPVGWRKLGENVGAGGSVERLHEAFMRSAPHRANVLGDFNYVAVAARRGGCGRLYVTVVFVKEPDAVLRAAASPDDEPAAHTGELVPTSNLTGQDR